MTAAGGLRVPQSPAERGEAAGGGRQARVPARVRLPGPDDAGPAGLPRSRCAGRARGWGAGAPGGLVVEGRVRREGSWLRGGVEEGRRRRWRG